jgi:CubicO group peptidase (beta-lactamase class C family)
LKEYGHQTLEADSPLIKTSNFFKLASCTKLITIIAALQCVDRNLITLDEPISNILPELGQLEIISWTNIQKKEFKLTKAKNQITLRQLLTHSSGIAYDNISPLLKAWRVSKGQRSLTMSGTVPEAFGCPLVFEPGEGWEYGGGVDWAGLLVRRLNNNITLEDYFIQNIFKPLGCSEPHPTFNLSQHPEAKARLVQLVRRTKKGLIAGTVALGENPVDELGGAGLVCSVDHFTAVLADIISNAPKLLKPKTADELFRPQFQLDSAPHKSMKPWGKIIESMAGKVAHDDVNQSLGGMTLVQEGNKGEPPRKITTWSGYTNMLWIASRDVGIAGVIGTQLTPPDDAVMSQVWTEWREDFWRV